MRASEKITFGATQAGFLSAQIDPVVVGPSNEGYTFRYTKVSAKPFKRSGVTVSQMGDYLRAVGITQRPQTPQEQADAVEATAGRIYQADLDWEAYCKGCKFTLKGMENFPTDESGKPSPWAKCPNCKQTGDDGKVTPVSLRANVRIDRFVSAAS